MTGRRKVRLGRMSMRAAVIASLSIPLLGGGVSAHAQVYSNPLVTPGFPLPGESFSSGPADPCVLEFEGSYYVYPTGNGVRYEVMGSGNLVK